VVKAFVTVDQLDLIFKTCEVQGACGREMASGIPIDTTANDLAVSDRPGIDQWIVTCHTLLRITTKLACQWTGLLEMLKTKWRKKCKKKNSACVRKEKFEVLDVGNRCGKGSGASSTNDAPDEESAYTHRRCKVLATCL
jgi:hypothetical protein